MVNKNYSTETEIIQRFQRDIGDKTLRRPAGLMGVSHATFDGWLQGVYRPQIETLLVSEQRIERALQCVRELKELAMAD